ncbi:MAG: carboxypeptidase regulatory-like domain-containing protein, partial [Ilumatobacteraceae bacterium]
QRPRISRWMMSLLGLLLAAAVFAAVLNRTFNRVVEEAGVDDRIIENALASGEAGGAVVPVDPAGVSGTVVSSSTGSGIAGIQADLFVADDTAVPIATAATDGEGTYNFSRLGEGTFKIRFSGAGFNGVWFGDSPTPADASEVAAKLGEVTTVDPFVIGARPGSVSGFVRGDDPAGARIVLTVRGRNDPETPAIVAEVESSADGSFLFEEVPSPAFYTMQVTKAGHATEEREVVLGPAEALEGIEITLRAGDGVISGTVSSPDGPLGGATVTATDGTTTIETVSLTDGTVGAFVLRNLATPGRYTLTVSRDGYADESRSVALDTAQSVSDFNVTLARSIGSISGRVSIADIGPSGGITVTVTGGDVAIVTTTVSQGDVGMFQVDQLPIPATYTVTFSREGLVDQVRLVDLDPLTGRLDVGGVDATLVQDRAVVRGIVRDVDGQPAVRARVELTDGTNVYRFLAADDPPGTFEFGSVAAGAYTLSAELTGTTPVIVLVNVRASETADIELRLGAQASISGRVLRSDPETSATGPFAGAVVRLFAPADFPANRDAALQVVTTDANGDFTFPGLAAPADFVVAVYVSSTAADPIDSALVASQPGEDVDVDPFVVNV